MYTACGHRVVEQLLRSITSLILLTTLGQPSVQPLLNIHILSDGAVSTEILPRSSNARYHVHPAQQATELFAPCATQRLFLHEHPAFQELDRVGPVQSSLLPSLRPVQFADPAEALTLCPPAVGDPCNLLSSTRCWGCFLQVIYLDIDTLWLGPPHFVWQQFDAMDTGGALFGMTEETTVMNEKGSWYAQGKLSLEQNALNVLAHVAPPVSCSTVEQDLGHLCTASLTNH